MNEDLPNNDLITRYLDGELNAEELQRFRLRLQNDPRFRQEVESMQLATEAVKYYGIRTTIAAVRQKMKAEVVKAPVKVFGMRRAVRYGLSVAATLFFVFIAIEGYQFYQLSSDGVYNETYISYSTTTRGEQNISAIEKAYSNKSYNEVISLGGNQLTTDKEKFFIGLSYLEVNQPANAIKLFSALNNDQSSFKEDAEFYLALSFLKQENYDQSLQLFQKIFNADSHSYQERVSKSLLKKIRMLRWKQ